MNAIARALKLARHGYATDGYVDDPMGTGTPQELQAQPEDQPGAYERAMDVATKVAGNVGHNVAGAYREGADTINESGRSITGQEGRLPVNALWQYPLGVASALSAPITGAAKSIGEGATYLTGNPEFGERAGFMAGMIDPTHAGAAAKLAMAGAGIKATNLAKEVIGANMAGHEFPGFLKAANEDKQYATSQEGPYYRITSGTSPENRQVLGGVREEVRPNAPDDVGSGGRGAYAPPELPSYESVAPLIKDQSQNIVQKAATDYTGKPIARPDMPESSLAKQSAIGRTFQLAAEDNPAYKKAIFKAYQEQMPDIVRESGARNYDELVAASYRQMGKETSAQFDTMPFSYSFHKGGEGNYANSKEMLADLHGNNHMRVFQGGEPHDFLGEIDPRTGLSANDKFRAVHDAFGHGIFGNAFGAKGEETAWGTHSQMYSPLARPAMTSETRGQNSFVNYTPINADLTSRINSINSKIAQAKQYGWRDVIPELETKRNELYSGWQYAPQKSVLLPPEFLSPSYEGGMPDYIQKLIKPEKGTASTYPLTHFSNEYGMSELDPTRYGTGIKGDEASRLRSSPGAVRDRSYFYLGEPSSVVPEEGLGEHVYTSQSNNLYDVTKDPLGLVPLAKESNRNSYLGNFNPGAVDTGRSQNDLERMIKEYGYEGMANPNAAFPMAAVFNPKPVEWKNSTRQTVANPERYAFPGIYDDPRKLAQEAESRVAPEDPALKRLFGVTRDDLYQIGKDRQGNMEPQISSNSKAKVPEPIQNIMTPRNEQRIIDALAEFNKQPGLRTGMVPWYVADPLYQRIEHLVGKEDAPEHYRRLNTIVSMMSPGSPVDTEINRGLAAHYLDRQGRIEDFYNYGGQGQAGKRPRGSDFPEDLRTMLSHPYHSTSQAAPLRKYIESGYPDIPEMSSPKVPLYIQSSGVPQTGFQTKLPVPDAHWTRGVGLPDTRTAKGFAPSMDMREYQHAGPWFRDKIASKVGMESVPAQALMWGGFSKPTGVDTLIGAPKIELLAKHIMSVADRLKISPEMARDMVLLGKVYSAGGSVVDRALSVTKKFGPATARDAVKSAKAVRGRPVKG